LTSYANKLYAHTSPVSILELHFSGGLNRPHIYQLILQLFRLHVAAALIDDVLNAGTDTESSQPAADSVAADSVAADSAAAPSGEKKVKKRAARYKCTIHGCIM